MEEILNYNYEKMYLHLFNRITDAIRAMEKHNYSEAADILRSAQRKSESIYVDGEDNTP